MNVPAVLGRICTDLADALGIPARQCWGTWETLPTGHYVEGSVDASEPGVETHPPLVRVQAFAGRSPETIERALRTVAGSVAAALGIPSDNVFVHYEELASGRVYSAGDVLR
jgi:hypothetical protein